MNFVDVFTSAFAVFHKSYGITTALEFGKWSCLGLYMVLEGSTIVSTSTFAFDQQLIS